jgi:hypothetical protein
MMSYQTTVKVKREDRRKFLSGRADLEASVEIMCTASAIEIYVSIGSKPIRSVPAPQTRPK